MTTKEKIKIGILAFLIVWIAIVITTGNAKGQSIQAKDHAKLQKELSFENYQRTYQKNRIKDLKESVRYSKESERAKKSQDRFRRREESLRAKI
jgi:uncharacterized protein YlxW (UPF0749 family)